MRDAAWLCCLLALVTLVGCGGKDGGSGGKSAAEARAELIATAKRMEGASWEAVELNVQAVENGGSWAIADEFISLGKYTPETIAAYQKWRAAKLSEDKTKKKIKK